MRGRSEGRYRIPILLAGAEVQYFEGITAMQDLSEMRVEQSPALMIEMPMCRWSSRMIMDIIELNHRDGYQVILAHIHRYLQFQNLPALRQLASAGVMMQVNGGLFSGFLKSRKALQMLDDGLIHILGSDCHNTTDRPPNLAAAYEYIERKRGIDAVQKLMNNGFRLLEEHADVRRIRSIELEYNFI